MTTASCSDRDFIALIEKVGVAGTAKALGVGERNVARRRRKLEGVIHRTINVDPAKRVSFDKPQWIELSVTNGEVLVGSDAHVWFEEPTTAWRAFTRFAKERKPAAIILNGDIIDGASISRHPPINWERRPELVEEIKAAQLLLRELEDLPSRLIWPIGNHDCRLETRLATVAPEFANLHGVHLKDHFPAWEPCYSANINGNVVVKHSWKGGDHAIWNNVIRAGVSMVTGHLHSGYVRSFRDYNGVRWAVDTGMLADPYGPQFMYSQDNPRNWMSGFALLTFREGRLLRPEMVDVVDHNLVSFRGEVVEV